MSRFLPTREKLIGLVVAVLLGSAGLFYGLRWVEASITFHPTRASYGERPLAAEDVWFDTQDHVRLDGWYFTSTSKPSLATIIYFHGNGGNISGLGWVGERLSRRGFDVLLFDYRSYGESGDGSLSEAALNIDGDAAYSFVLKEKHVSPERIVLFGQSLGSTVVADLASREKCGAVILESGLSSASSVANTALPWLPRWLHFLGKNRFESSRKLASVHVPVLVTHGDPDSIIPTEEGRLLFASANEPKRLLIFPGAGHNVFGTKGDEYLDVVEKFVRQAVK